MLAFGYMVPYAAQIQKILIDILIFEDEFDYLLKYGCNSSFSLHICHILKLFLQSVVYFIDEEIALQLLWGKMVQLIDVKGVELLQRRGVVING